LELGIFSKLSGVRILLLSNLMTYARGPLSNLKKQHHRKWSHTRISPPDLKLAGKLQERNTVK